MRKPSTPPPRRPRQFGTSRNLARAMSTQSPAEVMESVRVKIATRMSEIARLFVPGVTVTVLIRYPTDDRADVCVTDDEIQNLIAMLQRCQAREAEKAG